MPATSREWPPVAEPISTSTPFEARYSGVCASCGEGFPVGTPVQYNDNDELVCCVDDDAYTGDGAGFDSFNRGRTPGIAVMPRGKTKADRCGKCFIIHASGQVECE